ncbi:hypothetical protein [Variovorax sp. PBL-E5]|uniref:hypothetical protein n=1 Tax=Variovorax sp. PBL-E5 TaxID=434014 RepID=UPI001315CE52|nr:hypothetical protein [Variovorax sp. PBL-E5]VTU37129.1 hypothetical protein E5CHR_04493 [Variovorax sp. PBL-E5]
MNYDEAIEATVTREEALSEIEKHHAWRFTEAVAEFDADCGNRAAYKGAEVLGWLGY